MPTKVPQVSKVGAIGDIHAEDVRLSAVLRYLADVGVDKVLAVGDIVDGPGDPLRCCRLLEEHQAEVVMGNHDRWLVKDAVRAEAASGATDELRDFLEALPATREYETPAGPLLLCHGLGENDMNRLTPDDYGYAQEANDELQELLATKQYRFVINGHTHCRMVKDFGGVTIINVGTLFGEHEPCFAIIDLENAEVVFYDVDEVSAIREASRFPL